ncbi:MAG: glycosyltransferase family 1 protein [Bacteroidetes bacterium HGW-Bacteroidetes-15]|nr:MAG: glycosyltransferase family 1 protein [Bacteroidetes bacterium HGW-Bacteroidetes-15]
MKIGIIGTRGIPNQYGGFEQFAQFLSAGLIERGAEVWVYNSHNHPYKEIIWEGVNIIHCYDPEYAIGTAGQFIYDLNCIIDSRKRNFDIILQLGYTSSSIWHRLLPKKSSIITNMDGLEWKRSKYGTITKRFLKYAEKLAVRTSDALVADSEAIQEYLRKSYNVPSTFIPYGANIFNTPNPEKLKKFRVEPYNYFLLIARMQSDNHVEEIIQGVVQSGSKMPLLVIGNTLNKFGKYLTQKYKQENIRFLGGIYENDDTLNNLRHFSACYFHGHSAGGTNPSLLEAMAASAFICAHNNPFNRSVIGDNGLFFDTPLDISQIIIKKLYNHNRLTALDGNLKKLETIYSWQSVINSYFDLFEIHHCKE